MNTDQKMIAQPDAVAVQIAIGAGLSRPAAEALVTRVMQQVDQTRAAVEADRQSRMPSNEDLDKLSDDFHGFAGNHTRDGYLIPKFDYIGFARALLSRYGSSQPAASAEPVIYIWFAQSGTDLDHIQYWTRDPAQAARQETRFGRPPMRLFAVAAQAQPVPDDYARGRDAGWRYAMETVAEAMGGVPTERVLDVADVRAQDREDAERYRFWRDEARNTFDGGRAIDLIEAGGTRMDAATDAARAAKGSGDA